MAGSASRPKSGTKTVPDIFLNYSYKRRLFNTISYGIRRLAFGALRGTPLDRPGKHRCATVGGLPGGRPAAYGGGQKDATRCRPRPAHTRGGAGLRAKSSPHRREYVAETAEVCAGWRLFWSRIAPNPEPSRRTRGSPRADAPPDSYQGFARGGRSTISGLSPPRTAAPGAVGRLARTRRLRSATSSAPPTATSCAAVRGLPTGRAAGLPDHAPASPTTGHSQSDVMTSSCTQTPRISASRATSALRAAPPACCARTSASQARVASRVVAAPRCRPTS